jgi:hypothetical protein
VRPELLSGVQKLLLQESGLASWWEQSGPGFFFCIRCPCGGVLETALVEDLERSLAVYQVEARAFSRFHETYPDCEHIERYEMARSKPALTLKAASDYVANLEDQLHLFWGNE